MRIAVGLLAVLSAGALTSALADPQTDAQSAPAAAPAQAAPAASTAPAAAPAANTAASAAAAKPEIDQDVQHFQMLGYRPEMRHGQQLYCKREPVLGSRVNMQKVCGTIDELKASERQTHADMEQAQRHQTNSLGSGGH